jgi:oxygen-independent coproporphyrinogen-3 oxidase
MPEAIGLYVHVPFCIRRCPYCAFYSTESASAESLREYPDLLLKELRLRLEAWRGRRVASVYFGGGTPSLLEPAEINRLLESFAALFTFDSQAEITLETNPGTVDEARLRGFVQSGVNRLSLGIQSLDEARLAFLGRIHNRDQAWEALKLAQSAGFENVSVDLMVGTPLETAESWDREFDELLKYRPAGVSFYSLTVEEGTRLARRAEAGERVHLTQDETVDLMLHAAERLREAGYRHYEVSNWALPGSESKHNRHYWKRGSSLGLGPSAHSFDGQVRSWNLPTLQLYSRAIKEDRLPPSQSETLSADEARSEWIFLKLRQDEGLDLVAYGERFGQVPKYWSAMLESIAAKGLGAFDGVRFVPHDSGLLLADEIAARLLG